MESRVNSLVLCCMKMSLFLYGVTCVNIEVGFFSFMLFNYSEYPVAILSIEPRPYQRKAAVVVRHTWLTLSLCILVDSYVRLFTSTVSLFGADIGSF